MQTDLTRQDKFSFSNPDVRSWALVIAAAILWFALYNVIQPFANWLAYGLLPCRKARIWANRWRSSFTMCPKSFCFWAA